MPSNVMFTNDAVSLIKTSHIVQVVTHVSGVDDQVQVSVVSSSSKFRQRDRILGPEVAEEGERRRERVGFI